MRPVRLSLVAVFVLLLGIACSSRTNSVSLKDNVKKALEQVDLNNVTVTEDREKNTITLGGKVHSENAKQQAAEVAQAAASNRIIANEIRVEPVGAESQSRTIASKQDAAIEKAYKAALSAKGLDKEHIRFKAKNGVLTLKGSVKDPRERQEAQQIASNIPNVQQVLNEIEVNR
jgi:osmotically-inducible protein OsmY